MNQKQTTVIFVFCVLLVGAVGGGLAISSTLPADGDIPLQANSGLTVIYDNQDYPLNPFISNNEIAATNGSIQGGESQVRISNGFDISGEQQFNISRAPEQVRFNKSDSPTIGIQGSGIDSITVLPGPHTINDQQTDLRYTASGSANITLFDQQSDKALFLVDSNDGDLLALSDSDQQGEVTFKDVKVGTHNAEVRSGELQIRTIAEQPQLVNNNTNVTIRLFEQDTQRVIKRTTSTGKISLAEFPEDTRFTVVAQASGFVTRRTFISNIREQQRVYLLDNQTETSLVRFTLEDRTGQFSGDQQTTLKIQRSINTTDSGKQGEQYQTVSGDIVGGQLTFDSELENNVRYRVSVSNQDGDTRQLGAFLIKSPREINLVISGIDQGVDVPKQGPVISTTQQTQNNSKTLEFAYTDNGSKTSEVNVRVENARNSSEVFDTGSDSGNISEFKFSTTVSGDNADKQLVANYSYVRDGQQEQATQPYGSNSYPILTELDQGWAAIFGVGFLIISASLFSVRNARIGALVIPGIALMLNLVGILDGIVTLASVGLAFSIGIGVNLISNGFLK